MRLDDDDEILKALWVFEDSKTELDSFYDWLDNEILFALIFR